MQNRAVLDDTTKPVNIFMSNSDTSMSSVAIAQ